MRERFNTAMRRLRPAPVLIAAAGACLLMISCFEMDPPIGEALEIRFHPEGDVEVRVSVYIANPQVRFRQNPAVRKRIKAAQGDYLARIDSWSRRFEGVPWKEERYAWRKDQGELVGVTRSGVLANRADLDDFIRTFPLDATYSETRTHTEWTIITLSSSRTTRAQRDALEAFREEWLDAYAATLASVARFYGYLEDHPDRARDCLGKFYEDFLDEAVEASLSPPSKEEEVLLNAVGQSMGSLLEATQVPKESAYSPDELSRMEYDPFPAPLSVTVPGTIVESEGFEIHDTRSAAYPGTSLWQAFKKLEEAWYGPDLLIPLLPKLTLVDGSDDPIDLDSFTARPRWFVPPPSREEIAEAVETLLTPAPVYRIRWEKPEQPQKEQDAPQRR